jgi:PDZ domain-containing secreted protein
MKEKKRRTFLVAASVLIAFLIVAAGTAASVFAYRQLTEVEESEPQQLFSFQSEEIQQDDLLDEEEDDVDISEKGVLVTGVDPESPAAKAGIRRGSIILEVDGLQVNNIQELRSVIKEHEPGDILLLSVLNCDTPEDVSVTLASSGPYLGVEVSGNRGLGFGFDFNEDFRFFPEMPRGFGPGIPELPGIPDLPGMPRHFTPREPGLPGIPRHFDEFPFDQFPEEFDFTSSTVILDVIPDSPAEKAGLEAGDIIKAINGQEVENSEEIIEVITGMEPGDEISITVERAGESLELNATLGEHPEVENQAHLGVYIGKIVNIKISLTLV